MPGFYKKAVVWLGLNEEYPDAEQSTYGHGEWSNERGQAGSDDDGAPRAERPTAEGSTTDDRAGADRSVPGPSPSRSTPSPSAEVSSKDERPANPLGHSAMRDRSEGTVRAIPIDDDEPHASSSALSGGLSGGSRSSTMSGGSASASGARSDSGTVRAVPMPKTTKPHVIVPQSFNDAQRVADMFRDLKPVIVNMQQAERDLARRLIDFSSGLCYGLGGQMEKVAKDVYLLTPSDVEVAEEDRSAF